jgi:hypothetical protein
MLSFGLRDQTDQIDQVVNLILKKFGELNKKFPLNLVYDQIFSVPHLYGISWKSMPI